MQNVRFFVLAALTNGGPRHGHALLRHAASDPAGVTAGLTGGALYGVLTRLARERLIAPVRTERERGYPERVVYQVTEAGLAELERLRQRIVYTVSEPDDPFDLALVAGPAPTVPELSNILDARLARLRECRRRTAERLVAGREPLTAAEEAAVEHALAHLDADITWHERLLPRVPALIGERRWPTR